MESKVSSTTECLDKLVEKLLPPTEKTVSLLDSLLSKGINRTASWLEKRSKKNSSEDK